MRIVVLGQLPLNKIAPPPLNPNPNTNPTLSPNSNRGQFFGHYDAY